MIVQVCRNRTIGNKDQCDICNILIFLHLYSYFVFVCCFFLCYVFCFLFVCFREREREREKETDKDRQIDRGLEKREGGGAYRQADWQRQRKRGTC